MTKVGGDSFGDMTDGDSAYANNFKYRAWGAIKQLNYGTTDAALVSLDYDNRLRVSAHSVTSGVMSNSYLKKATFEYFADSRPKAMDNQVNSAFDRTFAYDFAGRLTGNQFGVDVSSSISPYSQSISYDAFSQMTARATTHWNKPNSFTASYLNGRKQPVNNQTPTYDAAGNEVDSGIRQSGGGYNHVGFDAANRQYKSETKFYRRTGLIATNAFLTTTTETFDGDGHAVKHSEENQRLTPSSSAVKTEYQIRSSVLGTELTKLKDDGSKEKTKVFAGGAMIAEQISDNTSTRVEWIHADPLTGSQTKVVKSGAIGYSEDAQTELEPLGQRVLTEQPFDDMSSGPGTMPASADEPEWMCKLPKHLQPMQCRIAAMEASNLLEVVRTYEPNLIIADLNMMNLVYSAQQFDNTLLSSSNIVA